MSDDQIDAVFNTMPNGPAGFCKEWGYRQFAYALLASTDDELERSDAENGRLRKILSEVTEALGTGAFASAACSIEFLSYIPEEVRKTVNALRGVEKGRT